MKPLLNWVGGKSTIADEIIQAMDVPATVARLVEPFCGGLGFTSVWARRFPKSELCLSDVEGRLISLYEACRTRALSLEAICSRYASKWETLTPEDRGDWWYDLRRRYNEGKVDDRDAVFLCLLRTGYNGLMRINADDHLTTPMGFFVPGGMYKHAKIRTFGSCLSSRWKFSVRSYEMAIADVTPGCVVYLDPPYLEDTTIVSKGFQNYSAAGCDMDFLTEFMRRCIRKGASRVAMSNASHPSHWRRELPEAEQISVYRRQGVNANAGVVGRPVIEEVLLLLRGKS